MLKVFVYFNLHSRLWSIKALEGVYKGKVLGHARSVCLHQVSPSVSATGRERVRREGKKNVHAGLVGDLVLVQGWQSFKGREVRVWKEETLKPHIDQLFEITYNPYKYDSFVYKSKEFETGYFKYEGSNIALLYNDRRVYVRS